MDADDLFTSPSHSSTTSMYLPTSVADATTDRRTVFEVIPFWEDGMDGGWFATVSTSIILLFGTFGNVMTIVILRRLRSGWSAMNVYLTALALSDTAMLYTGTLPVWTNKMFRYDLYSSHVVVCKAAVWVMNTTASLSAWLLVALTLQRAASVVSPYRVSLLCTRRRSVVVIVVISVVCSLLYSHTVFGYKLVAVPLEELEKGRSWAGAGSGSGSGSGLEPNATLPPTAGPQLVYLCTFGDAQYQKFSVSVWIRVDMFIYSVLPCALLISSNAVLGWKLAASIKEAQELKSVSGGTGAGAGAGAADANNSNSGDRRRKAAASSTTVTIIIISSVFVVLTLPLMVYNSWFQEYAVEESGKARALYDFVYEVFFLGGLSNYAWNFYLYCLTGSRFRGEFLDIMCRRRRRPVTSRVSYITASESQMTSSGVQKESSYSQDDF